MPCRRRVSRGWRSTQTATASKERMRSASVLWPSATSNTRSSPACSREWSRATSRSPSTSGMRSPLHATSPSRSGPLLIAAISGRALAAAGRRAGYRPWVADFFGDADTVAMADRVARLPGDLRNGIDGEGLLQTLSDLARDERPLAVVLGSGFEARTELVEKV